MMPSPIISLALSGLGRDALKFAAGLTLALLLALGVAASSLLAVLGGGAGAPPAAGGNRTGDGRTADHVADIPPTHLPVIQAAAVSCGLPWPVLAAVAKVESDFGRNMSTSSAGAIGYGQFLPSSWAAFGAGGDPYDFHHALPAMARYLCAHGGAHDIRGALWAYNHSWAYVDLVLSIAAGYHAAAADAPVDLVSAAALMTPVGRILALARAQLGRPYVWGGAMPHTGFDCSGLVQWVYAQAGLRLPRTAQAQFDATARLSPQQLQPGDLVFFARTYPSAEPITHVGIYAGNGRMVNAPREGDVVREMAVFTGYWGVHYAGAGRVRR